MSLSPLVEELELSSRVVIGVTETGGRFQENPVIPGLRRGIDKDRQKHQKESIIHNIDDYLRDEIVSSFRLISPV